MPDDLSPGIGTVLYASAATPTTEDAAGYAALSWVAVGEITEIPEYGPQSEVVTHTPLATGITAKYHGAINYGSLTIPLALARDDAGQTVLDTARRDRTRISFRIEYPKLDPASVTGATEYTQGKVFSFTRGASSGAVVSGSVQVEFEKETVEVDEL